MASRTPLTTITTTRAGEAVEEAGALSICLAKNPRETKGASQASVLGWSGRTAESTLEDRGARVPAALPLEAPGVELTAAVEGRDAATGLPQKIESNASF